MPRKGSPRVARDVRAAIADALAAASDPRLMLVTITEVVLTPDHEHATVYWSTPDPGLVSSDRRARGPRPARIDEVAAALAAASPMLRGAVGRRVRLRVTPELRFAQDPVAEQVELVDRLLREVREAAPVTDPEADPSVTPVTGPDAGTDEDAGTDPDAEPEGSR
jgi:ribosome-binding factor A